MIVVTGGAGFIGSNLLADRAAGELGRIVEKAAVRLHGEVLSDYLSH